MKNFADIVFGTAVVAMFLSIVGYGGYDLWLASTQWLLVSVALAVYAIYIRCREK